MTVHVVNYSAFKFIFSLSRIHIHIYTTLLIKSEVNSSLECNKRYMREVEGYDNKTHPKITLPLAEAVLRSPDT